MSKPKFVSLNIYRLSEDLSDEVWKIVLGWNSLAKFTVGKQLVQAADGVGANIAEGVGRGSFADNRRFVRIARGSLNETRHWLRRAHKRGLLSFEEEDKLSSILNELAPRLKAYLNSIGNTSGKELNSAEQRTTDH